MIPTVRIAVTGAGLIRLRHIYYERDDERSWFKPFVTRTEAVDREDPLAHQVEHFAAKIRGEAEPLVSARDGLANLRVTEAISEAARTGRVVDIA